MGESRNASGFRFAIIYHHSYFSWTPLLSPLCRYPVNNLTHQEKCRVSIKFLYRLLNMVRVTFFSSYLDVMSFLTFSVCQPAFPFSMSTVETPEQQCENCSKLTQNDVIDIVLVSLLLTLARFHILLCISIIGFDQVTVFWLHAQIINCIC